MTVWRSVTRRLLGLSLFAKILIANSAIVTVGAVAGTYVTTLHARVSPHETHLEIMVLFGAAGLAVSVAVNALILRAAFLPLTRLERTASRVSGGDLSARAQVGRVSDPETSALAISFNAMLDTIQSYTRQVEEYSVRLRELSDQVLVAQEDERRRLARELHDDTGQELSTLLLGMRLFRDAAAQPHPDVKALRAQSAELTELARSALDGVRRLALELRPRMLDDLGLATALRAYIEEWSARTGVPVRMRMELEDAPPLPSTTEIAVYRMVQEALVNVAKHAEAAQVEVSLTTDNGTLVAQVRDNGQGMALGGPVANGVAAGGALDRADAGGLSAGLGLFGTQERVSLVGGRLTVESAPGKGTTLRAVIPLEAAGQRNAPHHAGSEAAGESV